MSVSTCTKIVRIESKLFDVDSLRQEYGSFNIHTPKVEEKLRQGCETSKDLSGSFVWNSFNFQIVWPLSYPDSASLQVSVSPAGGSEKSLSEINQAVDIFACACQGSTNGCAADILTYAIELLSEIPPPAPPVRSTTLHVLKYNHLLMGNEHKKEKAMVSLAKKTLVGGICYGTPGLVVILGADEDTASAFLSDCRGIGKKGEISFQGVNCFTSTDDSECAKARAMEGRVGFLELTTADVQSCMGGVEVFKQHVLQM